MNKQPFYRGVKKRNYERLIAIALDEYELGHSLTISELAEKAGISRATAYRYFSTQNELISAMVKSSLAPILDWRSTQDNPQDNICDFLAFAFPQMLKHEGVFRAALQASLQNWADEKSTNTVLQDKLIRGNRKEVLCTILEPLKKQLPTDLYDTVIYALSIIYGSEMFVILKDIWWLDNQNIVSLSQWMAKAIINQAKLESSKLSAQQDK